MTATPTPLRELPAKWRRLSRYEEEDGELSVGDESAIRLRLCADELEAALSARDAAGAVDFERAAVLLERYAEVIRQAPHTEIERYDYLPEVEDMATLIRRLAAVAPAGMVLVPREPTDAMLIYCMGFSDETARRSYDAMLAAAPTPPATAGEESTP